MRGKVIKEILQDHGITLTELASLMEMSQPQLSQTLKSQDVKTGFLEKLCKALNVGFDYFYKGEDSPNVKFGENADYWSKKYQEEKEKRLSLEGQVESLTASYDKLLDRYTELSKK